MYVCVDNRIDCPAMHSLFLPLPSYSVSILLTGPYMSPDHGVKLAIFENWADQSGPATH
jgi:hypothetical protein